MVKQTVSNGLLSPFVPGPSPNHLLKGSLVGFLEEAALPSPDSFLYPVSVFSSFPLLALSLLSPSGPWVHKRFQTPLAVKGSCINAHPPNTVPWGRKAPVGVGMASLSASRLHRCRKGLMAWLLLHCGVLSGWITPTLAAQPSPAQLGGKLF